jgi:hypothetical protein
VIFSFAELELDEGLYQLRKRGKVVKLAPKAFDLLLYLIRHRDGVVSKAELLDELWPGEHVPMGTRSGPSPSPSWRGAGRGCWYQRTTRSTSYRGQVHLLSWSFSIWRLGGSLGASIGCARARRLATSLGYGNGQSARRHERL